MRADVTMAGELTIAGTLRLRFESQAAVEAARTWWDANGGWAASADALLVLVQLERWLQQAGHGASLRPDPALPWLGRQRVAAKLARARREVAQQGEATPPIGEG